MEFETRVKSRSSLPRFSGFKGSELQEGGAMSNQKASGGWTKKRTTREGTLARRTCRASPQNWLLQLPASPLPQNELPFLLVFFASLGGSLGFPLTGPLKGFFFCRGPILPASSSRRHRKLLVAEVFEFLELRSHLKASEAP